MLMRKCIGAAVLVSIAIAASPAHAGLLKSDLTRIEAAPKANAVLPFDVSLMGEDQAAPAKPLQVWMNGVPTVWILADFTCETLCGPVVSIVSSALTNSGLTPGRDFRLIVVGLDPKDSADSASAMKDEQIGKENALATNTFFLRGKDEDIARLTDAFGFTSIYDKETDQFAHPAAAYVVTADGHIARTLSGVGLAPADIRLALVDAGRGKVGTVRDHIRLLCYGFDPTRGVYTAAIGKILSVAGGFTIVSLVIFLAIMFRTQRGVSRR